MPDIRDTFAGRPDDPSKLAQRIVELASRDLVFTMQFLGESQYRVLDYFQRLVIRELEARGITRESHALLQIFIDSHACEMRDFVFNGVAMARPFRLEEIERMLGDTASVIRADTWDTLRAHIESVEAKFLSRGRRSAAATGRHRERSDPAECAVSVPRTPDEIFAERLQVVLELTELNARMTTATARVGGAEIEMASREDNCDAEAHAAAARSAAAQAALDDTARRVDDLTARLETLDRELHAATNREGDNP